MAEIIFLLLGVSFILFFGFLAEFIFRKIYVPDILFLITLGFIIGPFGLDYISPAKVSQVAPLFTTFALFFLVYHGAFNIDLGSFVRGLTKSLRITVYNFVISVGVVFIIMHLVTSDAMLSLLVGFMLGGISSAFVIPILRQLRVNSETYSILTLESTMTDVFTIVFSLTVIEIMVLQIFNPQAMVAKIVSLFVVAGFVGILGGVLWILLIAKVFKQYRSYMLTIAYLILIYVVTEFLGGNGTIAALFFGLVLGNSKKLTSLVGEIILRETEKRNILKPKKDGITVVSNTEMFFYSQISFFLKTFFFVYVGLLLNTSDTVSIAIGLGIAIAIMVMRYSSLFITRAYMEFDRSLISSTFARGLAAAVIAQEVVLNKIPNAEMIANITYSVIVFTIILSSINIFLVRGFAYKEPEKEVSPTAPQQE